MTNLRRFAQHLRRHGVKVLLVGAGLWAGYLILGSLFLGTALGPRVINRKPEKFSISWNQARTLLPGFVKIEGLDLRGQSRKIQWSLTADEASGWVMFPWLAVKSFRARGLRANGVDFRLRRRVDNTKATDEASGWPPIDGLNNPPTVKPEDLYPPRKPLLRWYIALSDVQVGLLRQLWIEGLRLRGAGSATGRSTYQFRGELKDTDATLHFPMAEVDLGGARLSDATALEVTVSLDTFVPSEVVGIDALAFVSGTADVSTQRLRLTALGPMVERTWPFSIDGETRLTTHLIADKGHLAPGSTLQLDTEEVEILSAGYRATGVSTLRAAVKAAAGAGGDSTAEAAPLQVEIEVAPFRLARVTTSGDYLFGDRLTVSARSHTLAIDPSLVTKLEAELDFRDARVPDLTVYNSYLPQGSRLQLLAGVGSMTTHLSVDSGRAQGTIDMEGREIAASYGSERLGGSIELHAKLSDIDLRKRRYTLSGTELTLQETLLGGSAEHPWRGQIDLQQATLEATQPPENPAGPRGFHFAGSVRAALDSSRPLVAVLGESKKILRPLEGLLDVRDVDASATIEADRESVRLENLSLAAEQLEVLGNLTLTPDSKEGLMFLRYGPMSTAVEWRDGRSEWKWLHSRAWFEETRTKPAPGQPH